MGRPVKPYKHGTATGHRRCREEDGRRCELCRAWKSAQMRRLHPPTGIKVGRPKGKITDLMDRLGRVESALNEILAWVKK